MGYAVSGGPKEKKAARALLKRVRLELKATVGQVLQMKSTPDLIFVEDDVTGGVARVQSLLDELSRNDASKKDSTSD